MSNVSQTYPCQLCFGVGIPGETMTYPPKKGSGKVWYASSLASGVMAANPLVLVTCPRCGGSGLTAERRIGAPDRRHNEVKA